MKMEFCNTILIQFEPCTGWSLFPSCWTGIEFKGKGSATPADRRVWVIWQFTVLSRLRLFVKITIKQCSNADYTVLLFQALLDKVKLSKVMLSFILWLDPFLGAIYGAFSHKIWYFSKIPLIILWITAKHFCIVLDLVIHTKKQYKKLPPGVCCGWQFTINS